LWPLLPVKRTLVTTKGLAGDAARRAGQTCMHGRNPAIEIIHASEGHIHRVLFGTHPRPTCLRHMHRVPIGTHPRPTCLPGLFVQMSFALVSQNPNQIQHSSTANMTICTHHTYLRVPHPPPGLTTPTCTQLHLPGPDEPATRVTRHLTTSTITTLAWPHCTCLHSLHSLGLTHDPHAPPTIRHRSNTAA
jgi:hypothetical protein